MLIHKVHLSQFKIRFGQTRYFVFTRRKPILSVCILRIKVDAVVVPFSMLSAGGDGTSSTQENDDARLVDFLTAFEIDNSSNMPSKIQEKEEETRDHEDAPPPAPRQRRLSFGGANSAKVAPATENVDLKDLGGSLVQDLERRRASESHSRWRFPMRPASVFESRLLRPSKLLRPARLLVNSEQKKILVKSPAQRMARRKHLEHAGFGHVQFDMRLRYEQEVSLAWYEKSFDHEGTFGRRWFRARVALQIYTMFRFPYRFAYGPKRVCGNCFAWIYEEGKSPWDYADYYSDLIPDLFFAADIVVNCFMTFDSAELDDEKVTDVRKIRRRYFRTSRLLKSSVPTAWLDVAGIIPFHVVWHMSSLPELAVQVASLPRLARIFKLFEWFGEIEFDAHLDFRVVALCKFTLMLFGMAHWVGCLWWLFARLRDFDETTWVALYNFAFNEHSDTSLSMVTPSHKFTPPKDNWHNYQIALYWGLNSMTGFGYSDVIPDNGVEMVFAIILCLVQLMYNAYILGTLFRCAVKKDEKSETYLKTIKHIDHYAEERRLPSELVSRMKRYVQFVASRESANQEHVLKQMPSSLVAKIAKWQHRKLLASTNVFDGVPEQYLTLLIVRLRARYLQRGDILFKMGDMAHELCFVQSGIVDEFEDDARRRPLRSVTEGILGELAFFMGIGQPCCDAASPQTDVVLQSISIEDYEDLLTSYAEGHAMAVSNIMAEFNISDSKDEANDATKKKESAGGDDHREKVRVALAATLKRRQDDALSVAVDAASEGDVETIRRIVQQGLDVNQGDYDGRTMLHLAAAEGNVKVARLLIEEGADVSVVDRWNQSPLHDAVSSEHQQVAQLLGAHGADLHFEDPAGVLCNLVAEEDFDGLKNTISFGTPPDS